MRALTFHGSHDVRIDRVAEPRLQEGACRDKGEIHSFGL